MRTIPYVDVFFFICSWVQVRSMSSYSTILIYTPTYNIFKLSKSRNYLFLKVISNLMHPMSKMCYFLIKLC